MDDIIHSSICVPFLACFHSFLGAVFSILLRCRLIYYAVFPHRAASITSGSDGCRETHHHCLQRETVTGNQGNAKKGKYATK